MNYSFIFGFKEGTELGYREVLLLGANLSVLALASVLANLDMEMDPITADYKPITELLPLGLVLVIILTMIYLMKYIHMHMLKNKHFSYFCAACDCDFAVPSQHLVPLEPLFSTRLRLPLPLSSSV